MVIEAEHTKNFQCAQQSSKSKKTDADHGAVELGGRGGGAVGRRHGAAADGGRLGGGGGRVGGGAPGGVAPAPPHDAGALALALAAQQVQAAQVLLQRRAPPAGIVLHMNQSSLSITKHCSQSVLKWPLHCQQVIRCVLRPLALSCIDWLLPLALPNCSGGCLHSSCFTHQNPGATACNHLASLWLCSSSLYLQIAHLTPNVLQAILLVKVKIWIMMQTETESLRRRVAFQWFLTAFSVRPLIRLAMSAQRLPSSRCT